MINNVSANRSTSNTHLASESYKQEVNADFLAMLTEKFSNDDIPDAHDTYLNAKKSDSGLSLLEEILQKDKNGNSILCSKELVQQDFESFQQMLDSALETAGISKDPPFNITSGATGRLYITGDHPDKEAIENILNGVPNIRDTYSRMSANSSLLAAVERATKFQHAYELDPQSAVDQYHYLFDSKPNDHFSIHIGEESYTANLISYAQEVNLDWLNFG